MLSIGLGEGLPGTICVLVEWYFVPTHGHDVDVLLEEKFQAA